MPAERFTKKATTDRLKRMWQHVYESAKAEGKSDAQAIIRANGVVKKHSGHGGRNRRRRTK